MWSKNGIWIFAESLNSNKKSFKFEVICLKQLFKGMPRESNIISIIEVFVRHSHFLSFIENTSHSIELLIVLVLAIDNTLQYD